MAKYKKIITPYIIILFLFALPVNAIAQNYHIIPESTNIEFSGLPLCKNVPIVLKRCIKSACIEKTPYGDIYRHILGWKNNICQYKETSTIMGGIVCSIPKKQLLFFAKNITNYYKNPYHMKKDIVSLIDNHCIKKTYYDLIPVHNLWRQTNSFSSLHQLSEANDFNYHHKDSSQPNILLSQPQQTLKRWNLPSIMFFADEVNFIRKLIGLSKVSDPTAPLNIKSNNTPVVTYFDLKAIRFNNNKDWTIWINNFKISNYHKTFLKIKNIDQHHVTLQWSTTKLPKIFPNWSKVTKKVKDNVFATKNNNIFIEKFHGIYNITFTLSPHQVFNALELNIRDSKIIR